MRSQVRVRNRRKILCVFPRYAPAFGTFAHAFPLLYRVHAFMPPQGLLMIAAYLPESWPVHFIDENIAPATADDFAWADAVFVSGMHVQAAAIRDIHRRARSAGRPVALGGPSASGAPEWYPDVDYLHVGEAGDATDALIARLDDSVEVPPSQVTFVTKERLPLGAFPIPAYDKIEIGRYLIGSLQFSSGCPYQCEFCDIPSLYGRVPRLKTPEQICAELDAIMAQAERPHTIYFVDDNFIGNRKAAKEMLPHLVEWQERNGFPFTFACEATLNISKQPDILELMRQAAFVNVFVGIESPDLNALSAMKKDQNAKLPILDSIATMNSYGMELTSGMIIGLDTDDDHSADRVIEFVERSNIPVLTVNLLQALPKTPLWTRLERDRRLVDDPRLESNVRFLRPYDEVVASWRRCIGHIYKPDNLYKRFRHQMRATYPNRRPPPLRSQLTLANLRQGAVLTSRLFMHAGVLSDHRWVYWRAFGEAVRRGQIDAALGMGFVSHHLIKFTREALRGEQNASFYSTRERAAREAMA